MKVIYRNLETGFEKVTSVATKVLGNSVTFLVALAIVMFWLTDKKFYEQDLHTCIGDIILGITFLSLFIIQKSFNRFSAALHIKLNELVLTHEPARNEIANVEEKTEQELNEISKEYAKIIAEEKSGDKPVDDK